MHKNIEVILKIPLPISQKEDVLLWHFNKRGEYTIKSCYQMALKIKLPNEPNSSPCNSKWWNALWSLNLTEKWRICYGGQPRIFCQLLRIYRKESAYKIRSVRDLTGVWKQSTMPYRSAKQKRKYESTSFLFNYQNASN